MSTSNEPSAISKPAKSGGCTTCAIVGVVLLGIPLLFCLFIAAVPVIEYSANQFKWSQLGSRNYTITIENDAYAGVCPNTGKWTVTVRDGRVLPGQEALEQYTVEGLFAQASRCILSSPFQSCSVQYDPNYGYPSQVSVTGSSPFGIVEHCTAIQVIGIQIDR